MKTPKPTLVLRCGCRVAFTDEPRCPTHGVTKVAAVESMPAPRIRGTATGPHVRTEDLAPYTAPLVEKGE